MGQEKDRLIVVIGVTSRKPKKTGKAYYISDLRNQ